MRAIIVVAGTAALVACSPAENEAKQTQSKSNSVANTAIVEKGAPDFEGFPTTQPNGSRLTADYCGEVGDRPGNPFDNTKTCLMIACQRGDKESCKEAETFNGNLWPNGVPPEEELITASNQGQ